MMQLNKPTTDIITDALQKYSNTQLPIDEFLHQLLNDAQVYLSTTEIEATISIISNTLEAISAAYQDIQRYKSRGLSLNIWLRDNLNKTIQDLPQAEQDSIIEAVKSAMNNSNVELFKRLNNGETNINVIADLVSSSFTDLNKTAIANNLKEELQLNTLLTVIALENISTDSQQEYTAAQAYFDTPLDTETDNDIKKVVAAAVEIAKKKNLLSDELTKASTIQITATVDAGITATKIAYKVAQNELEPITAIDYLMDKAAAGVMAVIDVTCQVVGENVGAVVGDAFGGLVSPELATIGAEIGREIGTMAGKTVADFVNTGVAIVATAAKSAVRTVCKVAQSAYNTVCSWLGF
jgi:hypothetical protein